MNPQIGQTQAIEVNAIAREFRIFRYGANPTLDPAVSYIFDDASIASVFAGRARWGQPTVQIDLEHKSVLCKETNPNWDPESRGNCQLAIRNKELWAVAVTWTADGAARIKDGRNRYISPTMYYEGFGLNCHITELFNIGLVASPQLLQMDSLWLAAASAEMSRRHPALSASERQACKDMGCTEAAFFALKSKRNAPVQRPVQRVAALSSNDAWFGKDSAQLFQIAKERGYVGGIDEIKAQIQADYNRDNQLAEAFGCTIGEIELTRSRLKLKKIVLSPEEKAICKELNVLENVFAWNKAMKDARK